MEYSQHRCVPAAVEPQAGWTEDLQSERLQQSNCSAQEPCDDEQRHTDAALTVRYLWNKWLLASWNLTMSEVTRILSQMESGDPDAARQLLPLVYDELRKMAAHRLSQEMPGQTLQATALVHEAYLRLVDVGGQGTYANRRHFFAAAAEAMRRTLVDQARRKQSLKRGGKFERTDEVAELIQTSMDPSEVLAVHELLDRLFHEHSRQAEVARLKFFLGCTFVEIGEILHVSADAARVDWVFARAWLKRAWLQDHS